jgi:hypothetical protein
MPIYNCELCNLSTSKKTDYIKHCKTNKHIKKVNILPITNNLTKSHGLTEVSPMTQKTKKIEESNKYTCEYCNNSYNRSCNLTRHYKKCSMTNSLLVKNKEYEMKLKHEQDLRKKDIDLHNKDIEQKEIYKQEMQYYKSLLNVAGNLVQKTVSSLNYIVSTYDDAPTIEQIKFSDIDTEDDKLIDDIFYNYNHSKLDQYIGDIIIKLYKKDDPSKQSIWSTDTNRLTYLLKKIIHDNKSRWVVDKKGVETMECIISPIIKQIRTLAIKYHSAELSKDGIKISRMELLNDIFSKLIWDIDNNKLQMDILKYISTHFVVNNKQLIET